MIKPIVWTIAGSDSSGGAGIQADLKVFENLGVHGCSVITALTAQNSKEIYDIQYTSPTMLFAQITALQNEFAPKAVKIGMADNLNIIEKFSGKIVLDPVIVSTSGKSLISDIHSYRNTLIKFLPSIDVITPNIPEVEMILQKKLQSPQEIEAAAKQFIAWGVKSILIKGGHINHPTLSQDYWSNGQESCWLTSPRYEPKNYRGTGCVYAAALTACLALGYEIKDAIVIAKMYVTRGIRLAQSLDTNTALLTHQGWPEDEIDMPYLSNEFLTQTYPGFPPCSDSILGLYPIVDSSNWIKQLLDVGVTTLQLRIKNKSGAELENEIQKSIQLSKNYNARLFINDFLELAIAHQAYGVHLGQEDLRTANIPALHKAGLRLGISTHCYHEVARAHTFKPSYIACGPIFLTTSKHMNFPPQGIDNLKRWKRTLHNYPLVAIGGINLENLPPILETGIDGIALISAITQAENPSHVTQQFLQLIGQHPCINSIDISDKSI